MSGELPVRGVAESGLFVPEAVAKQTPQDHPRSRDARHAQKIAAETTGCGSLNCQSPRYLTVPFRTTIHCAWSRGLGQ